MKLIFEKGNKGNQCSILPECDVPQVEISTPKREKPLHLPQLSENELSRHYTELAKEVHGVNNGFYPLGSCTMKYNPKVNEEAAAQKGFTRIHPLQPEHTVQGCMEVLKTSEKLLCEITGMDAMTFQPAAGAHGEFTGLLLIKAYHDSRNDKKRTKIIVPDSAHGTNPASAAMAGFTVVSVPSREDGCVDLDKLREVAGEDTAGLMLTNPNTVGLFDKNILEITSIIHEAGGLAYYDGANLNAVMGVVRPGDMGFDVVHINLHKTFSTPHGCGGPGSGPVGCKSFLQEFLPGRQVAGTEELSFKSQAIAAGDPLASDDPDNPKVAFIKETGELIFTSKYANELSRNNASINVSYTKTGFDAGEARPEYYYNCTMQKPDMDAPVKYTKENQQINFEISNGIMLPANTQASEVLSTDIGRDMNEMIDIVNTAINAHDKVDQIKHMMSLAQYEDEDSQKMLQTYLDAAEKEADYADDNLKKTYKQYLTNFSGYMEKVNIAHTNVGSLKQRLDLTKTRVENQQATVSELKSNNDNRDISDIIIDYYAAYNAYTSSLTAASKIGSQTLLNYL